MSKTLPLTLILISFFLHGCATNRQPEKTEVSKVENSQKSIDRNGCRKLVTGYLVCPKTHR